MFASILKELRIEKGLSQEELAKRLGYSRSTISAYEIGRNQPSFEDLLKIAETFNVSIDYLLGVSDSSLPFAIEYQVSHQFSLTELRLEKGLSKEAFAEKIGLSLANYSALESSGTSGLSENIAHRIAAVLNRPIGEIFTEKKAAPEERPLTERQRYFVSLLNGLADEDGEKLIEHAELLRRARKQ